MGKNERHAYLKEIRSRYRRSGRQAKSRILDEFCAVCGYHRKYELTHKEGYRRIKIENLLPHISGGGNPACLAESSSQSREHRPLA